MTSSQMERYVLIFKFTLLNHYVLQSYTIRTLRSLSCDRFIASFKPVLHTARSSSSTFSFQYLFFSLRPSNSCLHFLYLVFISSVFSSILYKQKVIPQPLLCLHLAVEVGASNRSVILRSSQKLFYRIRCVSQRHT
jgi:hypothetical protein